MIGVGAAATADGDAGTAAVPAQPASVSASAPATTLFKPDSFTGLMASFSSGNSQREASQALRRPCNIQSENARDREHDFLGPESHAPKVLVASGRQWTYLTH